MHWLPVKQKPRRILPGALRELFMSVVLVAVDRTLVDPAQSCSGFVTLWAMYPWWDFLPVVKLRTITCMATPAC